MALFFKLFIQNNFWSITFKWCFFIGASLVLGKYDIFGQTYKWATMIYLGKSIFGQYDIFGQAPILATKYKKEQENFCLFP